MSRTLVRVLSALDCVFADVGIGLIHGNEARRTAGGLGFHVSNLSTSLPHPGKRVVFPPDLR